MTNLEDDKGHAKKGIRGLVSIPFVAVQQPYRRWLERRAEQVEMDNQVGAIKGEAAEQMRNFHDALWERWRPEAINRILDEREVEQ